MSVSVLRNSREQPPLVAAAGEFGGANLDRGDGDGGGEKNSAAGASPRVAAPAVPSVAVASRAENEEKSEAPLNNDVECKNREPLVWVDKAVQHQPPPPLPAVSTDTQVTRNFKTSASTSTDVRAVARRACAPISAGFVPSLFNRQQGQQQVYRPRRRVHSVSEDDGNTPTRPDIFSASFPKRSRFPANVTYQFQSQKSAFVKNPANNSSYRRTGEPRFPKRARSGTNPLLNQPPAPNNTTQFLITDHEERSDLLPSTSTESGSADEVATVSTAAAADTLNDQSMSGDEACSSSGHRRRSSEAADTDEEFIEDPEFAAVCDDYNLERIMSMSRDEVNREMLETQKDNLHLSEKVEMLKADNMRLRAMLRDCGYDVSAPASLLGGATLFPLRKSTSPDTTLMNVDEEVTLKSNATPKSEEPE